jgi:predicted metal-dependent hydrolase
VELFDAGQYEEAHEAFEALWLSTEGPDSDFYKGLVQASIALHHFRRGNLEGAAKLHAGHRALLAAYLPAHHGIDVASFLRGMQDVLGPVARRRPGIEPRFDPERRPRLGPA